MVDFRHQPSRDGYEGGDCPRRPDFLDTGQSVLDVLPCDVDRLLTHLKPAEDTDYLVALFLGERVLPEKARGRKVSQWSRFVQLTNNSAHVALYEKSGGRLGTRMLGNQVGILTTVHRQTGEPYSVPLFTFHDGEDILIVASYRGSGGNPA